MGADERRCGAYGWSIFGGGLVMCGRCRRRFWIVDVVEAGQFAQKLHQDYKGVQRFGFDWRVACEKSGRPCRRSGSMPLVEEREKCA